MTPAWMTELSLSILTLQNIKQIKQNTENRAKISRINILL